MNLAVYQRLISANERGASEVENMEVFQAIDLTVTIAKYLKPSTRTHVKDIFHGAQSKRLKEYRNLLQKFVLQPWNTI